MRYWYVALATALMASQPLLTEASLNDDGKYDFIMITVTLSAEVLKLLLSTSLYFTLPGAQQSHSVIRVKDMLQFSIPAFVYFLNNNLVFYILSRITSTEFQILSCLKTVFTAIMFRFILKKLLSTTKWMAILTLACGAAVSQLRVDEPQVEVETERGSGHEFGVGMDDVAIGVIATVISCLLSSFAGVYNEVLLKRDGEVHSIHLQNIFLYLWGVSFNCIGLAIMCRNELSTTSFFEGYSAVVWILVLNNAFSGLAISAVLKFANNIVRIFAHAAAMAITSVFECIFFTHGVTQQLILSIVIVTASTVSYAADGPVVSSTTTPTKILLGLERAGTSTEKECELAAVS